MATRKQNTATVIQKKHTGTCFCFFCIHARLIQYGANPVLAECLKKPQPGNERFPYQREVAKVPRECDMYSDDTSEKKVEPRETVR